MTHDLLLDGRFVLRGYCDGRSVLCLLEEHETGRANHDDRIWALLSLELWFRAMIDERGKGHASLGEEGAMLRARPSVPTA